MDEQFPKTALDKFRQWHFWWLVVFSVLLIVIFVYYLPTRFLQQIGIKAPHGYEEDEHMQEHMKQGMTESEMMEHMKEEHKEGMMSDEDMMSDDMMHEKENMMSDGGEHSGDDHAAASYFEEFDIKEGLAINLNVNPVPYRVGMPLTFDFFVNQKPSNTPVVADQLQIEHEKLMHVIGVRTDLSEFFHIHPQSVPERESNPGHFYSSHVFQKPGLYKIWSEIKKGGTNYTFGHPEISIIGQGSNGDKPFDKVQGKQVSFERNMVAGDYQVSLKIGESVVKNRETDLIFDIHTLTGMEVDTEDYIGAKMHLTIIKDDLKQFIHTHPEDGQKHSFDFIYPERNREGSQHAFVSFGIQSVNAHGGEKESQSSAGGDETIDFHVTFPESGLYKAFAQFRPVGTDLPSDQALLAAFWIEVEASGKSFISSWTLLLLVSIFLIAVLSWAVSKYINVKGAE